MLISSVEQSDPDSQMNIYIYIYIYQDRVAQMVKHLPAMQETHVQSPGREDRLGKEMAYIYIFFTTVCHRTLTTGPCATQYDRVVSPSRM